MEKKPAAMSVDDAYESLGLARGTSHDDTKVRKTNYFLQDLLIFFFLNRYAKHTMLWLSNCIPIRIRMNKLVCDSMK